MIYMLILQLFLVLRICKAASTGQAFVNSNIGRCWAPKGLSAHPAEGTVVVHTSNCKDQSVFFRMLDSGAIQHESSGLCIHLSGNREYPRDREKAILMSDCTDPKYFFTFTSKNSFQLKNKCLRPISIRWPEGTDLISFRCEDYISTYNIIDVVKGCDQNCLENIIKAKETTNSFDAFFAKSEAEAKSFYSVSSTFFSTLKSETPELYKDLLSTHFPIDPKVIQNLEILIQHFGMEKVKSFSSLFLSAAFIRRHQGANVSKPAACGGTGNKVGGAPAIDEEDAEYKLSLSPNELSSLLDNENYEAQAAIDRERQADEEAGINTNEFKISMIQKLIDHWESKYYYKFWTKESLDIVMENCEVTDPSEIKFPSRGPGMTAIEYLEYYLSRNTSLLPEKNLKFPWPLSIALQIQSSLRQCNWIWRRLENGERIVRYSRYSFDYNTKEFRCKESDWNPCSIPRYVEDGGVCGRQSTLARVTNHCLGIASGGIKQPGHAAGYNYIKPETEFKFQRFQSIKNMLHTYTVWYLTDDANQREPKLNAEYHEGLTKAMNHGYESYRNGRIALLLFARLYNITIRHQSRELLVEALENNPHMMDVWMKLIHDVTGSNDLPVEGQNIFKRLPNKCPEDFNDSQRSRLLLLVNSHLNSYMQMYLEVLFRLISPPSCCSVKEPKYLDSLTKALNNEKRKDVKEYLFDAYVMCGTKSSTIPEFLDIVQPEILSRISGNRMPEIDPFSEILVSLDSLLKSREESEIHEHRKRLVEFYSVICDAFPKIHVTSSAWVIFAQYRVCKEAQLNFLSIYSSAEYEKTLKEWASLQTSLIDVRTWNDYHMKSWLYGRSGDIVPLLVGVKRSIEGAIIHEDKVNVAKNKPTAMSSKLKDETTSERAVDGLSDNNIAGGSCASTTKQNNPWFRVDLEKSIQVYGLLLTNAEEKAGRYLKGFEIHIGNNLEQNGVMNTKCGNLHAIRAGETRVFYCDPPVVGQYVTINIPGDNRILTICEIAVYDTVLANYRSHGVNLDIWHNIGSRNIQMLYEDSRYPNHPDEKRILGTFEYNNLGTNYGSRLSALYQPSETGNFTFYAACTDQCEVFLRDVYSGGELQRIISLIKATNRNEWTYDAQKSQPIFLDKEEYYELVATVKEASGRDYITLASESPSGTFNAPIPPERLYIGQAFVNSNIGRCWAPKGLSAHPAEGTVVIHTSNCKDQSVFFRMLDSGAIQHESSGLCIHLSGNREYPRDREKAILMSDCTDPKYFFTFTSKNSFQLKNKCLRPISIRWPEGTDLISFRCEDYISTYNILDVIKGCDQNCLENIIKAKETTNSFDAFFAKSEAEAKSFYSVSSTFFSTLKSETPELYKDLLSTHFPIDPKVIQNLEILIQHFGMEKVKSFSSLFLSAAFIRRHQGANVSKPAACGGTGNKVGGAPAIDEEDAEYKLSLSPNELSSLLDNENYEAQAAIDRERQADEEAGINTKEFKISMIQKLIDHWESKYYYKFWTKESLDIIMKKCKVTDPSKIKFPSRGPGMTAIEYLEYYLSRNTSLLPEKNLKFPWPLSIALQIQSSLRQCNWIWRRLENGERIVRYSRYSFDYKTKAFRCKESDWNPCSIPRYVEDGGVCGRQSTLARVTNHCLGIASGAIKQPGHAAGYNYIKPEAEFKFQRFQSIKNMLHTYTVWYLTDDANQREPKLNAEYHEGLTKAMNHGYESYRNGRIALLLFARIYNITIRHQSRELLVEALENNPHMMDVWMKLIHDVTGSHDLPVESQNIFKRLPKMCPEDFNDSQRSRLLLLVNSHLNSYMQMYLEVLFRLISPPSCCSGKEPKYLDSLTKALNNEKRKDVKEYLFDAYVMCGSKSSTIPEFLDIVQPEILSRISGNRMPEIDPFSEILVSLDSLLKSREESEIREHGKRLVEFYSVICDFPKIHVTSSAWVIVAQYRVCKEAQLNFLSTYSSAEYEKTLKEWATLQTSLIDVRTWNDYHMKSWLYGRSSDIVPLLVGVKTSIEGAIIHENKVNVAKNKPTAMSSKLKDETTSERAVDGLSDNNIAGGSCASTTKQNNPWLRVDLEKSIQVYGLLLTNAEGKAGRYHKGFEIHIGNNLEQNGIMNTKCGNLHAIRAGETRVFYCDPPVVGQYVTINIPGDNKILTICEIAVYDTVLANYRSHGVNLDIWHNIESRNIQKLYEDTRYPNHPDEKRILSTFEYNEVGRNYGSRLSALYQPSETGNFTFYAACTDQCEVFLRDVYSGGELQRIISLIKATNRNEWTKYDAQKSQPIFLDKEEYYELVATVKETSGRDYINLASESPSGTFNAPIPPERLYIEMKEESSVAS